MWTEKMRENKGYNALSNPAPLAPQPPHQQNFRTPPPSYHRPVCQYYLRGNCWFGDKCWNQHPEFLRNSQQNGCCPTQERTEEWRKRVEQALEEVLEKLEEKEEKKEEEERDAVQHELENVRTEVAQLRAQLKEERDLQESTGEAGLRAERRAGSKTKTGASKRVNHQFIQKSRHHADLRPQIGD